jgi:putative transposase
LTARANPYSEAGFKTLKYCPTFPDHFGSRQDAIVFCAKFIRYYNEDHHHSGIGLHTPASVHYGSAKAVQQRRTLVLDAAYAAHPERFMNKAPTPPALPSVAWINKPQPPEDTQKKS